MNQIYWLTDKYTSNLNISLQLSIYQSFQWRTVKYHFNYTSIYLWIREKLKLIQLWTKFIERLTNTLRIWTFHCNCLYISHFNEELSNIIVAELQIISGISEIWINAIYATNLLSVWQIHFEFEHFIAIVYISVISLKNYQISFQLNFNLSMNRTEIEIN